MTTCGTTHYEGCACHEARWQELLRELAQERDEARTEVERLRTLLCSTVPRTEEDERLEAEAARLREALDSLLFTAEPVGLLRLLSIGSDLHDACEDARKALSGFPGEDEVKNNA